MISFYYGSDKFNIFGFLGIVIITIYICIIIYNMLKKHVYYFSIIVLFIYICFLLDLVTGLKCTITYANTFWFIPIIICVVGEAVICIIKKFFVKK